MRELRPETEVQWLKGVGPYYAKRLEKLGIQTVRDVLYHFPLRYEERKSIRCLDVHQDCEDGMIVTVTGAIQNISLDISSKKRVKILTVVLDDGTARVTIKWFGNHTTGIRSKVERATRMQVVGKVKKGWRQKEILADSFCVDAEIQSVTDEVVPIYPLTDGITQEFIQRLVQMSLDVVHDIPDQFPQECFQGLGLLPQALKTLHTGKGDVQKAQERMKLEELLLLQLSVQYHQKNEKAGTKITAPGALMAEYMQRLPFRLTDAQYRVVQEIVADLQTSRSMNRLIQGDVGAGKTMVAFLSALYAIEAGYQVALMAPTDTLANQHYEKAKALPVKTALLTGATTKKQREQILKALHHGEIQLLIGTHALFVSDVQFYRLGLVIVDEQHKFGVMQRAALAFKGMHPNVMSMTATPIPRALTLTVYGGFDVSVIDELPPGRTPIKTQRVFGDRMVQLYDAITAQIQKGEQVYVVYPLVEESENMDLLAATEMAQVWATKIFPQFRIGLLHGKMRKKEKAAIMEAYRSRQIDILISTTVIEVGIDVSNATMMVIEHAERFGLAQLHQLRGRVGRGAKQSYCVLVAHFPMSNDAKQRLATMCTTNDGFVIAEKDIEIRGPGQMFGQRQSGALDLKIADIVKDVKLVSKAQLMARQWIRFLHQYPELLRTVERKASCLANG